MDNGLTVVELLDANGEVAGYSAGRSDDMAKLTLTAWSSSSHHGDAVQTLKSFMVNHVQELRQAAEEAGVDVNGDVFSTDMSSQIKYVGILAYASIDSTYTGMWKTVNNGFVVLDSPGVVMMCMFVMAYIRVCFAWEEYVLAQIEAATTVAQLQQIDLTTGRPFGQLPPAVIAGIMSSVTAVASTALTESAAPPTVAGGPAAGSTGLASTTPGSTDLAGQVNITASGTLSTDPGAVMATVTFSHTHASDPFVTISAANLAAASVKCYVTATASGFSISLGDDSGLAEASHLFNYVVAS